MKRYSFEWLTERLPISEIPNTLKSESYLYSKRENIFYLCTTDNDSYRFIDMNIHKMYVHKTRVVIVGGGGDILLAMKICGLLKDYSIPVHCSIMYSAGCYYGLLKHVSFEPHATYNTHGRGDMQSTDRESLRLLIRTHFEWMMHFSKIFSDEWRPFHEWQRTHLTNLTETLEGERLDLREHWFSRRVSDLRPNANFITVQE